MLLVAGTDLYLCVYVITQVGWCLMLHPETESHWNALSEVVGVAVHTVDGFVVHELFGWTCAKLGITVTV